VAPGKVRHSSRASLSLLVEVSLFNFCMFLHLMDYEYLVDYHHHHVPEGLGVFPVP